MTMRKCRNSRLFPRSQEPNGVSNRAGAHAPLFLDCGGADAAFGNLDAGGWTVRVLKESHRAFPSKAAPAAPHSKTLRVSGSAEGNAALKLRHNKGFITRSGGR